MLRKQSQRYPAKKKQTRKKQTRKKLTFWQLIEQSNGNNVKLLPLIEKQRYNLLEYTHLVKKLVEKYGELRKKLYEHSGQLLGMAYPRVDDIGFLEERWEGFLLYILSKGRYEYSRILRKPESILPIKNKFYIVQRIGFHLNPQFFWNPLYRAAGKVHNQAELQKILKPLIQNPKIPGGKIGKTPASPSPLENKFTNRKHSIINQFKKITPPQPMELETPFEIEPKQGGSVIGLPPRMF